MKLQNILLEKLSGGVKAKMLELTTVEPDRWKFTLRLVDPILNNVKMRWGYVTTALDSEDFDRKRVSNYYNQFKKEVLDNPTKWVFVTKQAPKKRTYGPRQVIEAEVLALPKKTKRNLDLNDLDNITDVELNTTKMILLDRVRNIELFQMPASYPYEPIKTAQAEKEAAVKKKTDDEATKKAAAEKAAETITYDPAKSNIVQKNVQQFQQLIIDKLDSRLQNIPTYQKFKSYGPDGKFGPATRSLIDMLEIAYGLQMTGNITPELMKKIGM